MSAIEGGRKRGKTVEDAVQFGERVFVDEFMVDDAFWTCEMWW